MTNGYKNKVEYKVQLLDDSTISCRVEKGSKGEELLNQVCMFLELEERDYFGLCFSHSKLHDLACWLQSKKPIHKQIGSASSGFQFKFRVKFYPPDPSKILQKEMTRYSFVCQLKKDISEERLVCSANTEVMLAAYALQAEMGDFDSDEHHEDGYIQQCAWFSDVTPPMEQSIKDAHKMIRSQSPADADVNFLDITRKLELYGIHQFEATDKDSTAIQVSVAWNGIHVFRCGSRQQVFPWSKVYKLDFKGRHFYIIFRANPEGPTKDTVGFKFANKQSSKVFWRRCVEYHAFFRLKRKDYYASRATLERNQANSLTRGTASRSTLPPQLPKQFSNDFNDPRTSTPRSREAEDINRPVDRSLTLEKGGAVEEDRGYSTLPPLYRKHTTPDALSNQLNSSVISVDSGSCILASSASQDPLSDPLSRLSPNDIFKHQGEDPNKEEFVALFQQISQELNKTEATVELDGERREEPLDMRDIMEERGEEAQIYCTENSVQISTTPLDSHLNGGSPNFSNSNGTPLHKTTSVASMPSRTSSRGSLSSEVVDPEYDTPTTIPLDLILDVGKSMPDAGFANYLSRYSKSGYSRLHAVSQEFVYTEKTYVKILGVLNTFLREINIPNGPFHNSQLLLLSNLYEMHQKFLRQLEDRLTAWSSDSKTLNIADILARNLCLFTLYTDYINDYNHTMERFNSSLQNESVFAKHVVLFEGRSSSAVSIPNLLLYPVLRIKQYQGLVDRLIDCVGEDDPSSADFHEVFNEINANTPPLTPELTKIMNCTLLQSLETEILGIKEIPVLGRVFLRRGMVRHITAARPLVRTLILLSDCLLYCKQKDKQLLLLNMFHVQDIEVVKSDEENVFAFTLTLPDHSSLELHVDDAQDAEKWVHDLKFTASIYRKRRKPEHLPTLTTAVEQAVQELCMVCGITLGRDKRHRTCKLCNKVLCTRCSSWKLPLPGQAEMQRVCESCYSRGDVRHRDMQVTQYTVQPPLISYGGDDLLSMEQLSGYVYVRSQNRSQWRRRWLELIFSKLFFYEADDDVKPLGTLDMLHLEVADTKYEDHVAANYAFKITSSTFSVVIACQTAYSLKRWLKVLEKATLACNSDTY